MELLTGNPGSTVRLPYVPNSMVMDQLGTNLYFGSPHELMIYSTSSNSLATQNINVPGVVLAVSPNGSHLLVNDQTARPLLPLQHLLQLIHHLRRPGSRSLLDPRLKYSLYRRQRCARRQSHQHTLRL